MWGFKVWRWFVCRLYEVAVSTRVFQWWEWMDVYVSPRTSLGCDVHLIKSIRNLISLSLTDFRVQIISWEADILSASPHISLHFSLTWRFITVFTTARYCPFWTRWVYLMFLHHISSSSELVMLFHLSLGLPSCLFQVFHLTLYTFLSYSTRTTYQTHHILLGLSAQIIFGVYKSWNSQLCRFLTV